MNQGRIWCVVNPTVGLPLFLGSVALISFTVHGAVLSNSAWYKDFYNGVSMTKTASAEKIIAPSSAMAKAGTSALTFEVTPVAATDSTPEASFVLKIKPKDVPPDPI
jgi:light-harvesting protein B-800-850 alpha chain